MKKTANKLFNRLNKDLGLCFMFYVLLTASFLENNVCDINSADFPLSQVIHVNIVFCRYERHPIILTRFFILKENVLFLSLVKAGGLLLITSYFKTYFFITKIIYLPIWNTTIHQFTLFGVSWWPTIYLFIKNCVAGRLSAIFF